MSDSRSMMLIVIVLLAIAVLFLVSLGLGGSQKGTPALTLDDFKEKANEFEQPGWSKGPANRLRWLVPEDMKDLVIWHYVKIDSEIIDSGGYIRDWLIIGAFPGNPNDDFLGGELNVGPKAAAEPGEDDTVTAGGVKRKWSRYKNDLVLDFKVEPKDDLDDDVILKRRVQQEFDRKRLAFPNSAKVLKKTDTKWLITRGNNTEYIIRKRVDILEVYKGKTNGKINFQAVYNAQNPATAYAFCILHSKDSKPVKFDINSGNDVAVWINGKKKNKNERSFQENLKSGDNYLLVKVSRRSGSVWGFTLMVTP